MANLTSPGVQVQIIDESFYASSGPGTVPFIMMATAQDKPQPGSAANIAPGTIKANAGKLYRISSQRELLQTFGNPKFYSQAGTPQHGNELNEYGLYTAYQYLGIANSAYVIRADLDLAQLAPTSLEPVGEPVNGDYWLDLANTTYGTFRSNGNYTPSLAWGAVAPSVITNSALLQRVVQAYRAVQLTEINSDIISVAGILTIAGANISLNNNESLTSVTQKINSTTALAEKGIRAEIVSRLEKSTSFSSVVTVYNMRLVGSDLNTSITVSAVATPSLLDDLGFNNSNLATPSQPTQNFIAPIDSFGAVGDLAINAVSQIGNGAPVPVTQVFEKISQVTDMGTITKWYPVGGNESQYPGHSWKAAIPTTVNSKRAAGAISAGLSNIYLNDPTFQNPPIPVVFTGGTVTQFAQEINNALTNTTVLASTYVVGTNTYLRLTDYAGGTIQIIDESANSGEGCFADAGMELASTYYKTVTGTVSNPNFVTSPGTQLIKITVGNTSATINVGEGPGPTDLAAVIAAINNNGTIGALIQASDDNNRLKLTSLTNSLFSVQNVVGYNTLAPFVQAGIPTGITYGRDLVYQGYSLAVPQPNTLAQVAPGNIWINTQPSNRGANYVIKRYNAGTDQWTAIAAPLYMDDASANAGYGANRNIGSLYVQYDSGMSVLTVSESAVLIPKIWTGTAWTSIPSYLADTVDIGDKYTQSTTTPTGLPTNGALWYNPTPRVDIMVSDGSAWQGYRTFYPSTDPDGVILSATAPSQQSGGAPLVDNDIWIDTSDLENYPKIYRRDAFNSQWLLVDNSDQSSSSGIVFADARWSSNGTSTGSQNIADLLVSSFVDPDAPSALPYPAGLMLFNTRYSTGNVKEYKVNYLPSVSANNLPNYDRNRWVTTSGLMNDGAPYMLRKAQRQMVIRGMGASITASQELKSETNFFNLMAAPGYPEMLDELVTVNTNKKDPAFVIVDTPARLQPDGMSIQNWATNSENATGTGEVGLTTSSRYAAAYYPWGLATNLDGSNIFVPPSTAVLRTFAFNDQVAYPWFAPAGFTRGLVSALSSVGYLSSEGEYVPVALNQGQRDTLYENKINPIAFIPGRGLVVYGQKTLNSVSSALDRVNVARLINFLNYQLDNLAKPFLFEPNDQYTRDSVARTFESFFGDLVSLRAVYDFAVLCDETNNTPERIDRNELWIDIAVKPTKAIEFIYIPLRILNTGDPLP